MHKIRIFFSENVYQFLIDVLSIVRFLLRLAYSVLSNNWHVHARGNSQQDCRK